MQKDVLQGVRVVDFGRFVAAPSCAAILGDLGAEVIRVEKREGGEDRWLGPVAEGGEGAMFLQNNRNKLSLTLNLSTEAGRAVAHRLVATADVVVTNLPDATLAAMGLDYPTLKAIKPDLVFTGISAYGRGGPYGNRLGFDAVGQVMSGAVSRSGWPDQPVRTVVPYIDFSTGLAAAVGTLAALMHRNATGEGQEVQASLLSTALMMTSAMLIEQAVVKPDRVAALNRGQLSAPNNIYAVTDGHILVQVVGQPIFRRFARLVGEEGWLDDPRFVDDKSRGEHWEVLDTRMEVFYAASASNMLGLCLVPLHPKGSLKDHSYVVRDAGLSALVFEACPVHTERARELARLGVAAIASLGGAVEGAADLQALAARHPPAPLKPAVLGPEDTIRLSYSGGTTGEPKAIEATARTLLTKTLIQLVEWEWPAEVRQLVCAPLSHAGGSQVLPTLVRGGTLHVLAAFDPEAVLQTIERERITCTLLIPTMIAALLDHPEIGRFDLSSLEAIYYGASPISPARLREGVARFGKVFFQFYGQTEAPVTVCVLRRDEHDVDDPRRLASCGRPVPWVRVALLGDDGAEVADGEPGEICVQGPLLMKGYWNKPAETAEAFKGGWLHSGDVAVRLPDGFLQIVDRKKDMIISGGFNVFAREVEDVLSEHPAVAHCAVIGVPDPRWGEAVKAVVVLRPGAAVRADELIARVRAEKGPVQAPKVVEFIDAMPLTGLGKPDKKALRARQDAALQGAA